MKEINEAYDAVTKQRSGGSSGGYSSAGGSYQSAYRQQSQSGDPTFARVRALINGNNLDQAEQLLRGINSRTAEWYFLSGSVAYRRGWLDEARQNYQVAVNMEPNNMEYRQAFNMMQQGGYAYRPAGQSGGMDAMDCCTTMMCLNCLCGGCGN